jgi:hypothetical protein
VVAALRFGELYAKVINDEDEFDTVGGMAKKAGHDI